MNEPAQWTRHLVLLPRHLVDLERHDLRTHGGEPVELRRQALELLVHLARHAGSVVSKEELLEQVWPGMVVTDDSLVQAVSDARRAIGDDAHGVIQTVPRRGYRLVAGDAPELPLAAGTLPVNGSTPPQPRASASAREAQDAQGAQEQPAGRRRWAVFGALVMLVVAGGIAAWQPWRDDAGTAQPRARSPAPDRPPIAVLDFAEADAAPDDRLMARAFSEELTNELSRNADLRVIASHSSFAAMQGADSTAQVGERLGARYLVAGNVRREGEALRLSVQLLEAPTGVVVWSERRSVGAAEVYLARDALIQRIAGSLHSTMRGSEKTRALQRPPASLDIYAMTLRAIALKHRFTPQDSREAKALLERVVAIDPKYAPGWLYLGMVNSLDALWQLNGPFTPERMNEAVAQMEHSITLDGNLPAAFLGLSFSYPFVGRHDDAVRAGRRCLGLGPSDAECMLFLATALMWVGDAAQALPLAQRAIERNPLPPSWVPHFHGLVLWASGDAEGAVRSIDKGLQLAPHNFVARTDRAVALVEAGRIDEARAEVAALQQRAPSRMLPAAVIAARGFASPQADVLIQRRHAALLRAGWLEASTAGRHVDAPRPARVIIRQRAARLRHRRQRGAGG